MIGLGLYNEDFLGLDFTNSEMDPSIHHRPMASYALDNAADPLANGKIFHVKDITAMTSPRPNHILKAAMLQRANKDMLANPFLSVGKGSASSSSLISRMLSAESLREKPILESIPSFGFSREDSAVNVDSTTRTDNGGSGNGNGNGGDGAPIQSNSHVSENAVIVAPSLENIDRIEVVPSTSKLIFNPIADAAVQVHQNVGPDQRVSSGGQNGSCTDTLLGADSIPFKISSVSKNSNSSTMDKTNKENSLSSNMIKDDLLPSKQNLHCDVTLVEWRLQRVPNDQQVRSFERCLLL